jgi:hypothetical protein
MARGRLAVAGVIALGALLCARPLHGQAGSHYVCVTSKGVPKSRVGVLYVTSAVPVAGSVGDLQAAWLDYAVKNLDPNAVAGIATCFIGTESNVSASRDAKVAVWRGSKIVDVDWKYVTSMTPMPSKPGAVYAWCSSGTFGGEKTVYESPVFEIPLADAQSTGSPVETAFANYMISKGLNKHIFQEWYSRSVGCPHSWVTRAAAEESRIKFEAEGRRQGRTVIQTGWVYVSHNTAPAAPRNKH